MKKSGSTSPRSGIDRPAPQIYPCFAVQCNVSAVGHPKGPGLELNGPYRVDVDASVDGNVAVTEQNPTLGV